FLDPAEPTAEGLHIVGVEAVETGDEPGILARGMLLDDPAHEAERKRHPAAFPDRPLVGLLEPRHHVDDCRLAGPVGREDAERIPQLDAERGAVKDHLARLARPEGLADILELEHPMALGRLASRTVLHPLR